MMKTEIEKKENNIVCKIVSLEYSHTSCTGRIYMNTKRVRKLLAENGHNPGTIVVDSHVDNCNNKLEGVWVFEDMDHIPSVAKVNSQVEQEKTAPKQARSNRRKSSRKTKKSLDKIVEDVIIEE